MRGTFATIHKKWINGDQVVYKTYSKLHGKLVLQHLKRELMALKQFDIQSEKDSRQHHIIYFMGHLDTAEAHHLIFPLYKQDLQSLLNNQKKNSKELANAFLYQISEGLEYMHQHDIIHCDLSPSNILIDDSLGYIHMFISDFGCAHHSFMSKEDDKKRDLGINDDDDVVVVVGKRYYKAPEHLFGSKKYAPSTDIWSLGVIFLEILIGYPIFAGETDIEQIGKIVFRLGIPSNKVQNNEMSSYPDINKLNFFFTTDEEEIGTKEEYRKSLQQVMDEERLSKEIQDIIKNTLTWSIKDRWTILSCKKNNIN
ncbi:kinase-like domain-containing protein [Cokeromyces recurvatus]|uniref:kinase-like domain-containing protein n=1 Tax=Cokeromyces recurvatus TaxID=90255 RepID=UPI00221FF0B6|nr:kinase-like domain-containing protein [Cokeromyces recurvatus]KAI7901592.1 kinase-like domain-containing protein [Cokeromyces recurvatus]